jgi:PAS domain S-box-containing protein
MAAHEVVNKMASDPALGWLRRTLHDGGDTSEVRRVINTLPAMAWTASADGAIDYVNDRWLKYIGQSRQEFERQGWQALMHPEDLHRSEDHWRATIRDETPSEIEHRVRRADGEYRWILARALPLRDEHGKLVRWYGAVVDIEKTKPALEWARSAGLSPRELEVLRLVVDGYTSKRIAAIVGVKASSIDTYRSRIMAKLQVRDLAGLVRQAMRHGLIED